MTEMDEDASHQYSKLRKKGTIVGEKKLSLVWTWNYFVMTLKSYVPDNSFPIIPFLHHMEKRNTIHHSSRFYFNLIMEIVFFWSLCPNCFLRFNACSDIFYLKCEPFKIFLSYLYSENNNSATAVVLMIF